MNRIEKLLLESAKQHTELGETLVSIYTIAKENEDENLVKMMMQAVSEIQEFTRTMVKIITYLERRMDME
jgi:hypothetical protein|tara:strand:- start:1768 stop:1977 length:210 start_codon:yes stop_codon:yes gene_type:complete